MRPDYNRYYETDDLEEDRLFRWRALCAVHEANNIVELCDGVPHGRVLAITAQGTARLRLR